MPFIFGTFIGMSPWCLLYATLGKTAGAVLRQNGEAFSIEGLDHMLAQVQTQLGTYSEEIELLGVGTAIMLAIFVLRVAKRGDIEA